MKLGEWLKMYRDKNNMTMQDLANACGFSKAYVGMLEKGINPTTRKPVSPTLQTLNKIARGTGQDIDSLMKCLDGDQPVIVTRSFGTLSDEQATVLSVFDNLNTEGRNLFMGILNSLKQSHGKGWDKSSNVVQNNRNGNNYFGVAGGNFNSNVTAV